MLEDPKPTPADAPAETGIEEPKGRFFPPAPPLEPEQPSHERLAQLIDSMGKEKGLRGRQFEDITKWFLENSPVYRQQIAKVWRWQDWPGREEFYRKDNIKPCAQDLGIDLVAETHDGKLWAIQAKGHSERTRIKKSEVDSFLAFSNTADFCFRLIVAANSRELGSWAKNELKKQEKDVQVLRRADLERQNLRWPTHVTQLHERPEPNFVPPREDQSGAVIEIGLGLERHGRGKAIMACGTGKTFVGLWTAELMDKKQILVLVPSLNLVSQALADWCTQSRRPLDFLGVCSEHGVYSSAERAVQSDLHIGIPVTTDPKRIAQFLSAKHDRPSVIFCTYHSSEAIAEAHKLIDHRFDLAICDESHHCAGPTAGPFATILDDEKIRADHRLFMTATPKVYGEASKNRLGSLGIDVVDMKDEQAFGPTLYRLSFREAIEQGLLADYRVVVLGVRQGEVDELLKDGNRFVSADGVELSAELLAAEIGLLKAARRFNLSRAITYHSSCNRAIDFKQSLETVARALPPSDTVQKSIRVWHLNGNHSSTHRNRVMAEFAGSGNSSLAVITNCSVLGEGVNIPTLDCVAFIDPRNSATDVVQNIGRVVRKSGDPRKIGTILLPILLRDDDDPSEAVDLSKYQRVMEVVRAISTLDPSFESALRNGRGSGDGESHFHDPYLKGRLVFDLDPELTGKIAQELYTVVVRSGMRDKEISSVDVIEWMLRWYGDRFEVPTRKTPKPQGDTILPENLTWSIIAARLQSGKVGFRGGKSSLQEELNYFTAKMDRLLSHWSYNWLQAYGESAPQEGEPYDSLGILPLDLTWEALGLARPRFCRGFNREILAPVLTTEIWQQYHRECLRGVPKLEMYHRVLLGLKKFDLLEGALEGKLRFQSRPAA